MKRCTGLILLLLAGALSIRAQQSHLGCVTTPPDFSKMSYNEANETTITESDSIETGEKKLCPEYVTNLVNEIRGGHLSDDNKALAIDLLGTVRPCDSNTIEFLIENIDFERTKFDDLNRISTQLKYPCEGALMKIGLPVINPILTHLTTETNELRRHLMCEVLAFVNKPINSSILVGKKAAQQQIEQKLADEAIRQANLEAALMELKK